MSTENVAEPNWSEKVLSSDTTKSAIKPRWSRMVAIDIVVMLDILAVVMGAFLPVLLYAVFGGLTPNVVLAVQSSMAAAVIVVLMLNAWGMYDPDQIHDLPGYPERLLGALAVAFIAVLGLGVPHAIDETQLWFWYAAWGVATYTFLLLNREISKFVLKKLTAAGRFDKRVAVFGAGKIARRVDEQFSNRARGVTFVGVFDDRIDKERMDLEGLNVVGGLTDLVEASRNGEIDQIVIALPQIAEGRMEMITDQLERLPVSVHIVTHIASDLLPAGALHKVSRIGDVGLLDVKDKALIGWSPFVKRAEDVVIGSAALLVVALITPIIALAIKLDSKGPVLFSQRRRGLNMKEFEVLKFRTMTVADDGDEDVAQATRNDPRVTRVGWFLRRFSLDELPQVFNVLMGEMSLVGPRPHAIAHDEEFGSSLERYANRHQVKPGITGLAQINGFRGEMTTIDQLEQRVALDIKYIKTWSLALDLKIIAKTLWAVVVGKNAY